MIYRHGRIAKLRKESKLTVGVREHAKKFQGNQKDRAIAISKEVLSHTLFTSEATMRKKFHSAHRILTRKERYNDNVCIDRCNLALGLLNAAGIKSWLARQVVFEVKGTNASWRIHDFVEAVIDDKLHTISFGRSLDSDYYGLKEGPVERVIGGGTFLRGIDSSHVGGVKDLETLRRFIKRVNGKSFFQREKVENSKRIDLMVKEGLIPKEIRDKLKG